MNRYDEHGRLTHLDPDDPKTQRPYIGVGGEERIGHAAHAVCQTCGKDMPHVWDVICRHCLGAFCYDHAKVVDGVWLCGDCRAQIALESDTAY